MRFHDKIGIQYGKYTALYRMPDKKSWMCECECGGLQSVQIGHLNCGRAVRCRWCAAASRRRNLEGQKFGKLKVISYSHSKNSLSHWLCRCECGGEKTISSGQLRSGSGLHCGCVPPKTKPIKDMSGQRFGRLVVVERTGMTQGHNVIWKCLCDCGNTSEVSGGSLQQGHTISCGCFHKERILEQSTIHGEARVKNRTPRYTMWVGAKKRSRDQNVPFNLDLEDIVIPEKCPILGISLKQNINGKTISPNSPSLDKIIPELGYVKGNIWVISARANQIKFNATVEELEMVAKAVRLKTEEIFST